ncbi:substrate-binding domain-containing protein [Methylovirgula sp. 4M-Z18]|uniref:substrate-binding domain-containing protein n=1 Tax=Methylovirgula sp. 4M-Z18 TaxID=2293567 RepID=UPI000E2F8BF6|nr:substrate-binding domain-containing protein [Methylovirgula sp. 4M-Z18]RFB80803.1 ABC transporter substrate-binding protein [Methylovirgula sp. 4M-Z18]
MLPKLLKVIGVLALLGGQAHAADLVVLAAAAVKKSVENVPDRFQKMTGDHVTFVFGTAGQIRKKAMADNSFAIVVLPPAPLTELIKGGLVVDGSRQDLGTVRLAAAVQSGATQPDLTDMQTFKQSLLNAPSIGLANPATGATTGTYLAELFKRMGIADQLSSKIKLYPDGLAAMQGLARGEVALGLGQKSEITPVAGVDLIGVLPDAAQLRTIYSAGLGSNSGDRQAAQRLLTYLRSPEMKAAFVANGFEEETK